MEIIIPPFELVLDPPVELELEVDELLVLDVVVEPPAQKSASGSPLYGLIQTDWHSPLTFRH